MTSLVGMLVKGIYSKRGIMLLWDQITYLKCRNYIQKEHRAEPGRFNYLKVYAFVTAANQALAIYHYSVVHICRSFKISELMRSEKV